MRRFKWFLIVSFVLTSSTLAWACGGGGGEKPSGPTAPAATSPAGKTPTVGETPQAQAGGGEFSSLADKFANATFKVTYQLSTGGATPTQGSITWYKKGDNLRMDIAGGILLGQQASSVLIIRPDTSYICTEGSCFTPPTITGGYSVLVTQFETALTDPGVDVLSTSSRNIAGEDAKCYTVSGPNIQGQVEMCLSGEGVPLYAKQFAVGAETTMEATEVSRDVSDSDFEPPYPLSDITGTPTGQ
jgi:hypothetical protein